MEFHKALGGELPNKPTDTRSEEHTSELQSRVEIVCRLLLEKKKTMAFFVQAIMKNVPADAARAPEGPVQHSTGSGEPSLSPTILRTDTSRPPAVFFLMIPPPPRSTLFPYTTLFRSLVVQHVANLLAFQPDEHIAEVLDLRDYEVAPYLVLATQGGLVKKSRLTEFDSARS